MSTWGPHWCGLPPEVAHPLNFKLLDIKWLIMSPLLLYHLLCFVRVEGEVLLTAASSEKLGKTLLSWDTGHVLSLWVKMELEWCRSLYFPGGKETFWSSSRPSTPGGPVNYSACSPTPLSQKILWWMEWALLACSHSGRWLGHLLGRGTTVAVVKHGRTMLRLSEFQNGGKNTGQLVSAWFESPQRDVVCSPGGWSSSVHLGWCNVSVIWCVVISGRVEAVQLLSLSLSQWLFLVHTLQLCTPSHCQTWMLGSEHTARGVPV